MNTKTKILTLFCIIILFATSTQATQTQELYIQDEPVTFTLLATEFCGYTEQVFRIQRTTYKQGIAPLSFTYNFTVYENNQNKTTKTIEKTINKYSSTKTGFLNSSNQITYHLWVRAAKQELFWTVQSNCTTQQPQLNNTFAPTNTTNVTSLTTTSVEEKTNTTVQQTTNRTTEKINATNTEEKNQITNKTEDCLLFSDIYTNENIYQPHEQMTMQFFLRPLTQTYSITYWIEDLEGNIIKKNITTSNINEKSYTFKPITQPEKAYKIKAIFQDTCGIQEKEKLIVVSNTDYVKEETRTKATEQLIIESITSKENAIVATIFVQKGHTAKTLVTCKQLTQENIEVQEEVKWYLLSKEQDMRIKLPLTKTNVESVLVCEGLGTAVIQELNNTSKQPDTCPEIIHTYTRHQYISPNATWYVRVKGKGEINMRVEVNNKTVKEQRSNITGEETISISIPLEENNTSIHTRITQKKCTQEKKDLLLLKNKDAETKTAIEKENLPLKQVFRNSSPPNPPNKITAQVITSEKNKTTSNVMHSIIFVLIITSAVLATKYLLTKRLKKQSKKDQ